MRREMSFLKEVFALSLMYGDWNLVKLRSELKKKHRIMRNIRAYFESTEYMPCGYQDMAGDQYDKAARDYHIHAHAYIFCKYGAWSRCTKILFLEVQNA